MTAFGSFNMEKKKLFVPDLKVVARALQEELSANFLTATVDVVDCPDLTADPFNLTSKGIGGSPSLLSCGSMYNFFPTLQKEKIFDIKDFPSLVGLDSASFIGATCSFGNNSVPETCVNASISGGKVKANETKTVRVDRQTNKYILESAPKNNTEYLGVLDLLCSKGEKSKVLEVHCVKRTSKETLQTIIRKALQTSFKDQLIGLGGVLLLKKGKGKCHVNHLSLDYQSSKTSVEDFVQEACSFYDMSAKLVSCGVIMSHDPGLELRLEHFHCFSCHGDGGHFHCDTTPESVEYLGYFSVAETLCRIDRPGKDT